MSTHDHDIAAGVLPATDAVMKKTASDGILRQYYELTKPGISQMVALSTLAGYYLAIPTDVMTAVRSMDSWLHFGATMVGTLAISSGSCVMNHVMEREHDARMKRTSTRPLPSGRITAGAATVFGMALTIVGAALLWNVNMLTFLLAVATWAFYLVVYTPMKRTSSLALLVGGIPGALPFAGGWTAVRGTMDAPAWALFAILFFWQMPHFLALSWMYRNDYREGGFVLRALQDDSGKVLGVQMTLYSVCMLVSILFPTILGVTGWLYAAGASLLGLWLTAESVRFVRIGDHAAARRVLLTSYAVLMGVLFLMFLDKA